MDKRKKQVLSEMEKVYSRVRHLGRKGKFREYKKSNQRIWERISKGYRGDKLAEEREKDCHNLVKQLSHYLYLFYFIFLLDLLHKEEV